THACSACPGALARPLVATVQDCPEHPLLFLASLVAAMHLCRRRGGLDGRKLGQDAVCVFGPSRHEPGISGFQCDGLPLEDELSLSRKDVANRLIVPFARRLFLRLLILPKSERDALSRHQICLIHAAAGRYLTAYFFDRGIHCHGPPIQYPIALSRNAVSFQRFRHAARRCQANARLISSTAPPITRASCIRAFARLPQRTQPVEKSELAFRHSAQSANQGP